MSLAPMLHSSEAQCQDDDWTGLRDRAERRKRQNRLNVRAHRKRKALEARQRETAATSTTADHPEGPSNPDPGLASGLRVVHWVPPGRNPCPTRKVEKICSPNDSSSNGDEHRPGRGSSADGVILQSRRSNPRLDSRSLQAGKPRLTGRLPPYFQTPAAWFPLYRDHLIPLVYYNVFRATITNIHILSLTSLLTSSCTPGPHTTPLFPSPSTVPPTLLPTKMQRLTPHEPWIDIFPSGTMRDNAIKFRAVYDHHDLCSDLVGCQEGDVCLDQPGIIAWSDPWHPDGWEVTEKFVERWGFLLKGCEDVMRATNRWRAFRDEEPLFWELE